MALIVPDVIDDQRSGMQKRPASGAPVKWHTGIFNQITMKPRHEPEKEFLRRFIVFHQGCGFAASQFGGRRKNGLQLRVKVNQRTEVARNFQKSCKQIHLVHGHIHLHTLQ